MAGSLYVVGTPIGNLEDMSVRAVRTLQEADFIAAEDTRVTLKLLNHFAIKKPMLSYHEHNARQKGGEILTRILNGENCAIVTDAGMPCISDPGEDLVRLCAENGVDIKVIPGPSAAISALAVSGLDTSRFVFEGFLNPQKKRAAGAAGTAQKRAAHPHLLRGAPQADRHAGGDAAGAGRPQNLAGARADQNL